MTSEVKEVLLRMSYYYRILHPIKRGRNNRKKHICVVIAILLIAAGVSVLAENPGKNHMFAAISPKLASPGASSAKSTPSAAKNESAPLAARQSSAASSKIDMATAPAQVSLEKADLPLRIYVSISQQRVTVYDSDGLIVKQFVCSTGTEGSETPVGTFRILMKGKSFYSKSVGEGGYYWTQFKGDYLFHSIPFDQNYKLKPEEAAKLGTPASHGCVRLSIEDAKWIYDHISRGTVVTIK